MSIFSFGKWNSGDTVGRWAGGIALFALAVAIASLCATYTVFSPTYDEPNHVAAGMEWLDKGTYHYEFQHPPLARIAVALGPYLAGLRAQSIWDASKEGNAVLGSRPPYVRNLKWARLGTLPFFLLACAVVYAWGKRWFGQKTGAAALVIFSCMPPVLGHAGLATTDVAVMAMVAAFLYQLLRWVEQPDWRRTVLLGLAAGGAFATKFSSFLFLPACAVAAAAYLFWTRRQRPDSCSGALRRRQLAAACALCFVVLWATYRFHVSPVSQLRGTHPGVDMYVSDARLRNAVYAVLEFPLPLSEISSGFNELANHAKVGHESYLYGEFRTRGWWYFFPLMVALKTPLGFLALALMGFAALPPKSRTTHWQRYLTALFPVVMLAVCMPSRINLGIRHVLVIYPMLAIVAGDLLVRRMENGGRSRILVMALAAWGVVGSAAAHPDYLAYFNEIAARSPERIRTDSDLDWGQDWYRLAARLRALRVKSVSVGCFCNFEPSMLNLPPYGDLPRDAPVAGYVAISANLLEMEHAKDGAYGWLRKFQPLERVGKSIFLYHIPDGAP